ncbi:SusC/RagA family TonB-linked outer membrane protein [Ekhidna sp.]|uniref:SusC/RagA family TonB-linked outer membrane protein n=1 Tax=Ekhidna sp. TaxID=2608089 RepID=UPI003B5BF18C
MMKNYLKRKLMVLAFMVPISFLMAQDVRVSGTVTDASNGEPLPGVTVLVKGTTNGTITGINGEYELSVPSGSTIVFSSIGYSSQEVLASEAGDLAMRTDVTNLDEVVVTGLATSVKRSNLANSVSTVSSEQLTGMTNQGTVDGALYGKMTGVNLTSISGAPGGGVAMRLRGISSIKGNNQPLIIIDGIYMSNAEIPSGSRFASGANRGNEEQSSNRLADLDPNDIQNIEVLKGASAAAIYGTRANAGVIIITTKRGSQGKTQFSLSQDVGFSKAVRLLGTRDWDAASVAATYGDGEVAAFNASGEIYDYEEELFGETGLITNTNFSARGGNEKTTFYIGGSVRKEDGIMKNTGFDRYNIRANIDHKISDRVKITSASSFIRSETSRGFTGNENEGGLAVVYNLAYTRPWYNLYPDANGVYPDNPSASGNMILVRDQARNEDKVNRTLQSLNFEADLIKKENQVLKFKWNGGLDFFINETLVYVPEYHQAQAGIQNGYIGVGKNTFTNLNYTAFLNHDIYIGDLSLSTSAGISYLNFKREFVYNQATQLIQGQTALTQATAYDITQTFENEEEFGFVFQEQANYNDQIIGTIGIRFDKSSLNGDPNKYYSFFKGSLAANIHNFDFWSVDQINQLKVRVAYGETGSSATYGALFTTFDRNAAGGVGGSIIDQQRGTPGLEPETSQELEFGFDVGLFDGIVGLEFTAYNRKVKDLLFDRGLPSSVGFSTQVLNDADLENKGIEIALNARPVSNENVTWNTTVNWWKNEATYTRLGVPSFTAPGNGFGLGLGTFYIEEGGSVTGIYQNVDGTPTEVGNTQPDFQMSFYNTVNFLKNFDFSFLLHWKKGGENLNLSSLLFDDGGTNPAIDDRGSQYAASYIEPAGYWRLREVALYYSIPQSALGVFNGAIKGVKIGASGRNLWTKTDYLGYDPEVSTNGTNALGTGLDVGPYPNNRQVFFHLNLNF